MGMFDVPLRLLILMMTHAFFSSSCAWLAYWVMLLLLSLFLLSAHSLISFPFLSSLSLVFRTLLFNIFVPLVLNFSTFCASFLCCHCRISCCSCPYFCCCCCCYYVRAKLLVKCLSGAESLTQFSLGHCICMTHTALTHKQTQHTKRRGVESETEIGRQKDRDRGEKELCELLLKFYFRLRATFLCWALLKTVIRTVQSRILKDNNNNKLRTTQKQRNRNYRKVDSNSTAQKFLSMQIGISKLELFLFV